MKAIALAKKRNYTTAETVLKNCSITPETAGNVCNLDYLNCITRGNKTAAGNLAVIFFTEINEELAHLQIALEKSNYAAISNIAHKMKSAFAILGITILGPVIYEMEYLSNKATSIEIISQHIQRIHLVFNKAKVEMEFCQ
jgi:HPt (histidine-containing phosphotransfer) domain-containing protein